VPKIATQFFSISKATFGMTSNEYKQHKNLPKQSKANLRDHMNDMELIFTMIGEGVTTEITRNKDSKHLEECKESAKEGGDVAGNARKDAERKIGRSISTNNNYLVETEK